MDITNQPRVLVLGGTGRTGSRVLARLLEEGADVRAIVRSAARVPHDLQQRPNLTLVEADLCSLPDEELAKYVRESDAVISCLGHNISLRGVFGPPRDLVCGSVERVCRLAQDAERAAPLRLVVMSSVSVNRPGEPDTRRAGAERAVLALMRALVPPAKDNQRTADYLWREIGVENEAVEWVAVRPDTLGDGDVCEYAVHEELVDSLFKPGDTNMANVADFMCRLATEDDTWGRWRGKLPVVVNAVGAPTA